MTSAEENGSESVAATVSRRLARAFDHHGAGRLTEAEQAYREIIALDPEGSPIAYNNLGTICRTGGDLDEALRHYRAAVRLHPAYVDPHFNIGMVHELRHQYAEALAAYQQAAGLDPGNAEFWFRSGVVAVKLERNDIAMGYFRRVLERAPGHAGAWMNVGLLLSQSRQFAEAEAAYRRALEFDPRHYEAATGLAGLCLRQGRVIEAAKLLRAALSWKADYAPAVTTLANVSLKLLQLAEAEELARRSLALDPDGPDGWRILAKALHAQGRQEEALAVLESVGRAGDRSLRRRCTLPFYRLPMAYDDTDQIERVRGTYRHELSVLADEAAASPALRKEMAEWMGENYPFNLAYQQADDRDLQSIHGRMIVAAMAERYPRFAVPPPMPARGGSGRIRLGVACAFFRVHTVWKLFRGWFRRIDRTRFETFAYISGRVRDPLTEEIHGIFDRVADVNDLPVEEAAARIRDDGLHLLFYPEVGMDPLSVSLAALRLAPVQCLSFGHPDTTGMPSLDYFISADLMEPADAAAHYTEPLVRLPGIGLCYDPVPLKIRPFDLRDHGVGAADTVYLCCQNQMKYLPRHDGIFPTIAAAVPGAKFVFLDAGDGAKLRHRLTRAFAAAGLAAERHLIFIARLPQDRFLGLNQASHVFLDSIGWSGGNTTFEALLSGLPVVTLPTGLMRGRVSYALLAAMDMPETVARSVDDYVAIAIRLGKDAAWRAACVAKVVERRARVLSDVSTVRAFENFVVAAVARAEAGLPVIESGP